MALAQAVCSDSCSAMGGAKGTWVSVEDFRNLSILSIHICEESLAASGILSCGNICKPRES